MQRSSTTTIDTETLTRELNELDRVLHRMRERLASPSGTAGSSSYAALRKLRGILNGKLIEDPLTYQQRIRTESDRRIILP